MIKLQIVGGVGHRRGHLSVTGADHCNAAATAGVTSFEGMIEPHTFPLHKLKGQRLTHR